MESDLKKMILDKSKELFEIIRDFIGVIDESLPDSGEFNDKIIDCILYKSISYIVFYRMHMTNLDCQKYLDLFFDGIFFSVENLIVKQNEMKKLIEDGDRNNTDTNTSEKT